MYLLLEIVINLNIPAYPESGNVITGNLKIVSDKRIHAIVSKGPKYRFPPHELISKNVARKSLVRLMNSKIADASEKVLSLVF